MKLLRQFQNIIQTIEIKYEFYHLSATAVSYSAQSTMNGLDGVYVLYDCTEHYRVIEYYSG